MRCVLLIGQYTASYSECTAYYWSHSSQPWRRRCCASECQARSDCWQYRRATSRAGCRRPSRRPSSTLRTSGASAAVVWMVRFIRRRGPNFENCARRCPRSRPACGAPRATRFRRRRAARCSRRTSSTRSDRTCPDGGTRTISATGRRTRRSSPRPTNGPSRSPRSSVWLRSRCRPCPAACLATPSPTRRASGRGRPSRRTSTTSSSSSTPTTSTTSSPPPPRTRAGHQK
mmetsp:Transcript_3048/g.7421  ORF Transcript_3048/g.7421 Transcript_3048/m.7421 type:complete len:230 (+) Transcript_3048:65-754(+)